MEPLETLQAADLAATMVRFRDALRIHQDAINRLNVYPVPDGDTGTNMALTVESVVTELDGARPAIERPVPGRLAAQASVPAGPDAARPGSGRSQNAAAGARTREEQVGGPDGTARSMSAVCRAVAHGSLMGARGNSGVILSQLLRGFTATLGPEEHVGATQLADALMTASDAAVEAVLRPVEGTILTVSRAAAEGAGSAVRQGATLVEVVDAARRFAAEALEHTPEQLPVLAQAGVVDAGGAGYLLLLDAMLSVIDGRPLPPAPARSGVAVPERSPVGEATTADVGDEEPGHLRYEVMYLLHAPDDTIVDFREVWAGIGDSIVVVGGEGLWNCHIHTNDVGAAIEAALDVGRPRDIRVTDLVEQMEEERWVREASTSAMAEDVPAWPVAHTAVVAVANGEGIGRIFRSLGVHHLVPGGPSMNPSTEQILEVVQSVPSPEVVLLPNNENIHPVAMQVCELADRPVRVVPTGGIVEGFAALLEYDPGATAEENARSMADSARRIVAGEVTRAVRDAVTPAGPIGQGDFLGLSREGVEVVADSLVDATCGLLGKLLRGEHELVTLIEGEGAGVAETRRVTEWLAEHRPDIAVEVHHGGQPLYPYLLSIE